MGRANQGAGGSAGRDSEGGEVTGLAALHIEVKHWGEPGMVCQSRHSGYHCEQCGWMTHVVKWLGRKLLCIDCAVDFAAAIDPWDEESLKQLGRVP